MIAINNHRRLFAIATLAGAALLSGCASMNAVTSSVATYGTWPSGMATGSYAFDRLPSQQANLKRELELEAAAAHALEMAGFHPAPEAARADVNVQLGARIERFESSPWDDPLWVSGIHRGYGFPGAWVAPYGPYGIGGPYGPYWHPWITQPDQYQREVALLIRDGASGKPLYEARATSNGYSEGGVRLLSAMFDAALKDFPNSADKPHDVTAAVPPAVAVPMPAPATAPAKAP